MMINSLTIISNQIAHYATWISDIGSPYIMKVVTLLSPRIDRVSLLACSTILNVAVYLSSHSVASIYCATVAVEASIRGSGCLLMGISNLFYSIVKKEKIEDQDSQQNSRNTLKLAVQHAGFALLFSLGALNPVTGVVIPIIAGTIQNIRDPDIQLWETKPESISYVTIGTIQKIPQKICKITAYVLSKLTYLPQTVTNIALSALTMIIAVHFMKTIGTPATGAPVI